MIIDEGVSKLTRLQNEIGILDAESRLSDTIKTQTLLVGLRSEYKATLTALKAGTKIKFDELVTRLKKAEIRIKIQG